MGSHKAQGVCRLLRGDATVSSAFAAGTMALTHTKSPAVDFQMVPAIRQVLLGLNRCYRVNAWLGNVLSKLHRREY